MKKNYLYILGSLAAMFAVLGCNKDEQVFDEPYQPGKEALGIKIDPILAPVPASGNPGTEVTVKGTGMLKYKDDLVFRFNGEIAEITAVTDSEVKAKVPDYASTGVTSVSVGDIIVFGPEFTVAGKIKVDPTFRPLAGTNGVVNQVVRMPDGKLFMVGGFTNYDNKGIVRPINRIVRTFPDGTYDPSFRSGSGANGFLSSLLPLGNKFLIAGLFSGYGQRNGNISNITLLNSNGTIDTMGVHTFRRPDQNDTIQYFPKFNGGFDGGVASIYEHEGKIIATGPFRYYISRRYDEPNLYETRDTVILDSVEARLIVRLNTDGTLDKTYRFDASGKSFRAANGYVETYMHQTGTEKGKLLVSGSFTTFDGNPVGYITRLNTDGMIDESFKSGSGANDYIYSSTYNEELEKYVITGVFRSYNGDPISGIAVLNKDGTLDPSFTPRVLEGYATYAKMLDDGLIVVSGGFNKYDGVTRNGFMVLDPGGALAAGYNAIGDFRGALYDVVETRSEDGKRALLLLGSFDRFDNEEAHNVLRVVLE